MNPQLPTISARSSPIDLADWLELRALADRDQNASRQDLVAELRRNGTVDAYDEGSVLDTDVYADELGRTDDAADIVVDSRGELTESIAESALDEVANRARAAQSGYVYEVYDDYIQLKPTIDVGASTYIFQLLLSTLGPREADEAKLHPDRQFELICVQALQSYLGTTAKTRGFRFGWPREEPYSNFAQAVSHIISLIGEGGAFKADDLARASKDDKLDVIVSIPFDDDAASQLIAFGQCATGADWESKLSELYDPGKWCQRWMTEPPLVSPIKTFFVPHCIHYGRWKGASLQAGILFERCRISSKFARLDDPEFQPARDWILRVLQT